MGGVVCVSVFLVHFVTGWGMSQHEVTALVRYWNAACFRVSRELASWPLVTHSLVDSIVGDLIQLIFFLIKLLSRLLQNTDICLAKDAGILPWIRWAQSCTLFYESLLLLKETSCKKVNSCKLVERDAWELLTFLIPLLLLRHPFRAKLDLSPLLEVFLNGY